VQLLDAQQNNAAAAAINWFSPADAPPDSGELDSHHTLFAIIHRIYSRRQTGKLQLVFGRVEKALFFDTGELVFATSNDRQDGLGEVMLRGGALTQSQFEEASTLVETGQRFGSAIAEMGICGVEQVLSWVRTQVLQIAASVLDYPTGRYFFFSSLEKNVVPEIGPPLALGKMLLVAARKAGDLPLNQLVEDADLQLGLVSDGLRRFTVEDLEDVERRLLSQISRHISAKQVISQSGLPRLEASRALYALLLLGFVIGLPSQGRTEREPVVPTPSAEPEQQKVAKAPIAANIPDQRSADVPVAAEEAAPKESEPPSVQNVTPTQPPIEQTPIALEPPKEEAKESAKEVEVSPPTSVANASEQQVANIPVPVEEVVPKVSEAPSVQNLTPAPPQFEEAPIELEEPKETEAPPTASLPLLKPNAISREVRVRATGISSEKNEVGRQLFDEETTSVLVAETGGVIRLSAAVTPGQLLILANLETKGEVIVQILRKRAYKPTSCYLELEFVEPLPRFWGTEFSAATALLPRNAQDVEVATMVITAEATTDQPWILPTAPNASEVEAFKREVADLRTKPVLTETAPTNPEETALAQLRAEGHATAAIPAHGDGLSTEAILQSGLDAAGAVAPSKRETEPGRWEEPEQAEPPQPITEFLNSLPKSKRWRMPRGSFTPEFKRVARVAGILLTVVVLGVGIAWFKILLPRKSAANLKKAGAHDNLKVASDDPVTTSAAPSAASAPPSDADATAAADGSAAPAEVASAATPAEPTASSKKTSGATKAGKASPVRPAPKPATKPQVTPAKDSAVTPPKLIHSAQAVASLSALGDFERGNVVIDAVVGTEGEVHFISVISGPESLRAAAVESLKEYKYEPAMRSGQPVPAHVTITMHFRFEP
jgi:periplasmic protein TonB